MPMQIQVKVENKEVVQSLTKLGPAIDGLVQADIKAAMNAALIDLRKDGRPIRYPVNWDSEKQRRAYFASDGFGHGIPYKRTGGYNAGWQVEKMGTRSFALINKEPGSMYVGGGASGRRQSRIHRGRWPVAAEVVRKHVEKLLVNIPQAVKRAIRSAGFGL